MKNILSFVVFVMLSLPLLADPVSVNQRPRFESMGHAGLAVSGGPDSAIMNPAGLADVTESKWDIFPLTFELPFLVDSISAGLDYADVADSDSATDEEKREAAGKLFEEVASESIGARLNLYPSYTRKYMHIGLLLDAVLDTKFQLGGFAGNQMAESGDTSITAGMILGGAYGFLDNKLQVGLTLKPLFRNSPLRERYQTVSSVLAGFNKDVSVKDELFGDSPASRVAFGLGVDAGVKYWIPENLPGMAMLKPAVGLTYQDIGHTRFFTDDELPQDIQQSISAGVAIHPIWKFIRGVAAFDFRNINEEQAFLNKIHFGTEAVLWDFWALRFGVSQGYLTGGMGLDVPFFELDIYVTAEESGRYAHIDDKRSIGIRISANI